MTSSTDRERAEALAPYATVAIVTALPKEEAAVKAMLDGPVPFSTGGRAPGEYFLGTVPSRDGGKHVVLLARIGVGENLATGNTTVLLERVPRIQQVLVVGIAGAVPDPTRLEHDVRLGDIVVSDLIGVIQYDHDKELIREGEVVNETRHPPRPPAARLLDAHEHLMVAELGNERPWEDFFQRAESLAWTRRPDGSDVLHDAVDIAKVVPRLADIERRVDRPKVFRGPIASGNKLLKNPKLRERLRTTFGAKAVEMEAAGVADATWLQQAGYFVVRGTCDYCDGSKGDTWQGYAAMVAAAYARALLGQMRSAESPPDDLDDVGAGDPDLSFAPPDIQASLATTTLSPAVLRSLAELSFAELEPDVFDASWPSGRRWPTDVLQALSEVLSTSGVKLDDSEWTIALAAPLLTSSILKKQIVTKLDPNFDEELFHRTISELMVATPLVADLLDANIPQPAAKLVWRWGALRLLHEHRRNWTDTEIAAQSPDVALARWMAADSSARCLLRAVAGDVIQFESLPAKGLFHFEGQRFPVRWRLLACLLSLAECRVLGLNLLSPEVVQHVLRLPDLVPAVEAHFKEMAVTTEKDGTWVVRGRCVEPVLDAAMTEIATTLDSELRGRRAPMSDELAKLGFGGYPRVHASPEPQVVDGVPRYTRPHVSFALSSEHARRLLMGADLWKDARLAFRELYQNALDACRYRVARSRYLEIPYVPAIRLYQGRDANGREFVECEDNGIGMDREVVASCFAMAGKRFVNTDAFRREQSAWSEKGITVNVNSQFGIGVFSYFMVADELEIETARMNRDDSGFSARLLLRIPTASSFFRIVNLSAREAREAARARTRERGDPESGHIDPGTRVRLWLRPAEKEATGIGAAYPSCVDAIKQHVWFAEVRTEVRHHRGDRFELDAEKLAPWIVDAVEAGTDEPRLWWVTDTRDPVNASGAEVTTFRSRKSQNGGTGTYGCPGRVLVDGIATNATTPGFIINLRGTNTPKLSLDRFELRSSISDLLTTRVATAVSSIPTDVGEAFLSDLWTWDPRVLHQANEHVAQRVLSWQVKPRFWRRSEGEPTATATRSYFPPPLKDPFSNQDYRNALLQLCQLAREMPDAQEQTASVLEGRYVPTEFSSRLGYIPKDLWLAWGEMHLGVSEAAALAARVDDRLSPMAAAYVSWLTGDVPSVCEARVRTFAEAMDLRTTIAHFNDSHIEDHDAWLLGCGNFAMPWIGPAITTIDAVLFAKRTGVTLDETIRKYGALSSALGIANNIDPGLAASIGLVSDDEDTFISSLVSDRRYVLRPGSVTDERAQLLVTAAGVSCPSKKRELAPFSGSEYEKSVYKQMLRNRSDGLLTGTLDLATLCDAANALTLSLRQASVDIRAVADRSGFQCTWTNGDIDAVETFTKVDWTLARGASWSSTLLRTPSARTLAARLIAESFWVREQYGPPSGVWDGLRRIFALFGWGTVPLSSAQIEHVLTLTYGHVSLLQALPRDGVLSIPRIAVIAQRTGTSFRDLSQQIAELAPIGVQGPSDDATYLGLKWGVLSKADVVATDMSHTGNQ